MKQNSLLAVFFVLLFAAGCTNNCKDVLCSLGQTCSNGTCYCNDGYYGTNCDSLSYIYYVNHTYYVTDGCSGYSGYYATMSYANTSTVTINNFFNQGVSITAYLKGDDSHSPNNLYIPQQSFAGSGTVQGTGYRIPGTNRINFTLNYTFNFQSGTCTQTFQYQS